MKIIDSPTHGKWKKLFAWTPKLTDDNELIWLEFYFARKFHRECGYQSFNVVCRYRCSDYHISKGSLRNLTKTK